VRDVEKGMRLGEDNTGDSIPGDEDEGMCLLRERKEGSGRGRVVRGSVNAKVCERPLRVSDRKNQGAVAKVCYLPIISKGNYM